MEPILGFEKAAAIADGATTAELPGSFDNVLIGLSVSCVEKQTVTCIFPELHPAEAYCI